MVNNAGYGVIGPAADGDLAEQLGMIDLNIRALTEISLVFAPKLAEARGKLLNVASIAAFMPGPGMADLLRQQGLCPVLQRGLVGGMGAARRQRHRALSRPGARPAFQARARFSGKWT